MGEIPSEPAPHCCDVQQKGVAPSEKDQKDGSWRDKVHTGPQEAEW